MASLELFADVTTTSLGDNHVTFTINVVDGVSRDSRALLDLGDGSPAVTVPLDPDTQSGTYETEFTDVGIYTYTATASVILADGVTSWTALKTSEPAWIPDTVDAYGTWGDVPGSTVTATADYTISIGNAGVTAEVMPGSPPYIRITTVILEGTVTSWTLTRMCPDSSSTILHNQVIAAGDTHPGQMVLEDLGAPFNTRVWYVLTVTYSTGESAEYNSNTVILSGVTGCYVSDADTGRTMPIEIMTWTELDRAARRSVLEVVGRPDPIVLSDVHTWPSSSIVFLTRSRSQLVSLRSILLEGARVVLVRTMEGSSLEAAYLQVGDVKEKRLYEIDGTAWERQVEVDAQQVLPPPVTARDSRVNWGDLYGEFATWAEVPANFYTWADVVSWIPDTLLVEEAAA